MPTNDILPGMPQPGEEVKVSLDETPLPVPRPQISGKVVTGPSAYHGLPTEVADLFTKMDANSGSMYRRTVGMDLPKYAFQLGAGALEGVSLGTVDPGQTPKTTGETFLRYGGQILGATFVPVGPAVKAASKLTGGSALAKMTTGAMANIAATEIQTKGEASKERLILDATLGAVFGKFYNTELHWANTARAAKIPYWSRSPDIREPNIPRPFSPEGYGSPDFREVAPGSINAPTPRRAPEPLALPDYTQTRAPITPSRHVATSPEVPPETSTDALLRQAQQTLTGKPTRLPEFEGTSIAPRDIINKRGELVSPLAIEDVGLFKKMGVKAKRGTITEVKGDNAQHVLNKLMLNRSPEVREAAKEAKVFLKHSDDYDTTGLAKKLEDVSKGVPHPSGDALNLELWENPREFINEIPSSKLATGITPWSYYGTPAKFVFGDVQHATKGRIPAFEHYWEGSQLRELGTRQQAKGAEVLIPALKGTKTRTANGLMEIFTTKDTGQQQVSKTVHMVTDEQLARGTKAYNQLKTDWDRNFPDTPFEKFMTEYIPVLRKGDPNEIELLKFDPAVKTMAESFTLNHEFSFKEKNFVKFSAQLNRSLALHEHFDPFVRKVQGIINDPAYPAEYKNYLAEWTRRARGTESLFAKKFNPVYKKMWQRMGVDPTDKDVRDVINNVISLTHLGALGFKPSSVLKNSFNTLQTGARIGYSDLWHGMRKAMTKEGWEMGRVAGMVDEAAHEAEALRELGAPGRFSRAVMAGTRAGLKLYGGIDDFNRNAVYIGMHDRFLRAVGKAGNDIEKLKELSAIERFHPAVVEHVMKEFSKNGAKSAAHLAGVHAAQDTQWVYRTTARPVGLSGDATRMFSQFGIWSVNYLEYGKQMLMGPIPRKAKIAWFKDYLRGNATVVGAMTATGASVGLGYEAFKSSMGWTGLGPLAYQGGPSVDFARAVPGLLKDIQDGVIEQNADKIFQGENWRQMKAAAMTTVPAIGVARDVMTASGAGAEFLEGLPVVGPGFEKLRSKKDMPAESAAQELFRIGTGTRVRE